MGDVFVSYKREERERVRSLVAALEASDLAVYWDTVIPVGESWRSHIASHLTSARCVVVVWTNASIESRWVQDEAEDGLRRGALVPVMLEQVEAPLGFRSIQAANLVGWRGDASDPVFQALLKNIRSKLSAPERLMSPPEHRLRPRAIAAPRVRWGAIALSLAVLMAAIGWIRFGTRPSSGADSGTQQAPSATSISDSSTAKAVGAFDLNLFRELADYAYSAAGLNMSKADAAAWAERQLQADPAFSIERYKVLRDYAYSAAGLNMTTGDATAWADARVHEKTFDIKAFQELVDYAYSSNGLNMSKNDAAAWALSKSRSAK